jgi:D-beta-D-heptose 7-phosphate kinase / D-beta-D-heptose 1-phosphate adenosyltransferase
VCLDLLHPDKVLPAELLPAVREAAGARKVVFTNGCFDVLHAGHVQCLREAKEQGDVLVVGLNSDASVHRLKGPARPVMRQDDRAAMLAALGCVDRVVIFDADTPTELVRVLRPDVLVKGGEYEDRPIAGEEHAGRVHLVEMLPGRSTTATLARLQDVRS